jgi:hypothetical protein
MALLLLPVVPLTTAVGEPGIDPDAFAADFVQLGKIRQEVGLPEHLLKEDAKRNGVELDLKRYFEVFGVGLRHHVLVRQPNVSNT